MSKVHGSDDASALVGMPGFVVRAQVLRDGEWWLAVETATERAWCPSCGVRAVGHGRARSVVRDLPIAGVATVLVFARRRWLCPEALCAMRTWSEHVDAVARRASLTERARRRLADMVNIEGWSIAAAGVEFGVGWHTANQAVAAYTDPAVEDPARLDGVTSIGVDEKRFLNATSTHRTVFTTQIVDLDRHRLLDVIEGRSRDVLADWLAERGNEGGAQIRLATLDPAAGYRAALIEHLEHATLVVDHFHAIKVRHEASCIRRRVRDPPLRAVAAAR